MMDQRIPIGDGPPSVVSLICKSVNFLHAEY